MKYSQLTKHDIQFITDTFNNYSHAYKAEEMLSDHYGVRERTIRRWKKQLNFVKKPIGKVLIYDIETSRAEFKCFWTGKQWVSTNQMTKHPEIISVAWKWLGDNKVYSLFWDNNHSDKTLVEEFLKQYNSADLVVGFNNDNFDNRWIQARAMYHGFKLNNFIRSLDIIKEVKRTARLAGYSLKFLCEYFGVQKKHQHEGIEMWDKIEDGTLDQQKESLKDMIVYNEADVISTEELMIRLQPYFRHKIHLAVLQGGERYECPSCGGVGKLYKTTVTPAGTIQRIMECCTQYKISNKQYMNYLDENNL